MSLACTTSTPPGSLVVGLGNSLMQDDGVGVHAVRQLLLEQLPDTRALEVGTDVFSAISWLESAHWVLVIDAMDAGGPPGTIYHCDLSQIANTTRPVSLHELSLVAVLEFIPPARRPEITVLGVQPATVGYGLELTPALEQALPRVLEAARALIGARDGSLRTVPRVCPETEPQAV